MKSLKVIFTGDCNFCGVFKENVTSSLPIFDTYLERIFSSGDYNVVNLEGPCTAKHHYLRKEDLRNQPGAIHYLKKNHFNIFNLANNHLFDAGKEGYNDTVNEIISENGIFYGAGINLSEALKYAVIQKDTLKIALIGFSHKEGVIASEGAAGVLSISHLKQIVQLIKEAKKECRWVIVNYHGGEEFTRVPMPSRRKLSHTLIDAGADLVINHHAHVFQPVEEYRGKQIFHSLGNFIFDYPGHAMYRYTNESAILSLEFNLDNYSYKLMPFKMDKESRMLRHNENSTLMINFPSSTYKRLWMEESYRVFFAPKFSSSGVGHNQYKKSNTIFNKLVRRSFYHSLIDSIWSDNKRPMLWASLCYKLRKVVRL